MPDCQCERLDRRFDARIAEDDLRDYERHGADGSTRLLLDRLRATGVTDQTLIDVGGGVGIVQLELLADGLASATDVDASAAYLAVARRVAAARGFADRVTYRQGDFVTIAADLEPADLVTLDRVICCYPDLDALVASSAGRARRLVAVVHPHDRWWTRVGIAVLNLVGRPFRQPRFFVHRTARLEANLRSAGFRRDWVGGTRLWRVAIYRRSGVN